MTRTSISESIHKLASGASATFWFGAVPPAEIDRLQTLLGCSLPPSFKTFLEECGGGGVEGEEISGVEGGDAALETRGSVLGDTKAAREEFRLPVDMVVIYFVEEACWCLQTSRAGPDGECPVVSYDVHNHSIDGQLGGTFAEFLAEYTKNHT